MTERNIASRPSLEQVMAIVEFMEKHSALGLGQLRDLEGREESKKLWLELTRTVNNISGPVRPMKSWIKFWADKKTNVRSKVLSSDGDPSCLCSHIERRIWDVFLANTADNERPRRVKKEKDSDVDPIYHENVDDSQMETEPVDDFLDQSPSVDDRQMAVMEKLAKVMVDQAEAMSQMAIASQVNARAMERLAEASNIQAKAIERIASSFDSIGRNAHDVRNSIVEIDTTMKRFYNTTSIKHNYE